MHYKSPLTQTLISRSLNEMHQMKADEKQTEKTFIRISDPAPHIAESA